MSDIRQLIQKAYSIRFDSEPLSPDKLSELIEKYIQLYEQLRNILGNDWREPLVNWDIWNALYLEWWVDARKLTLYIEPEGINYIVGNKGEFLYGEINNLSELVPTYKWLLGDKEE